MKHQALATIHFVGTSRPVGPFLVCVGLGEQEPPWKAGEAWDLAVDPVTDLGERPTPSELEAFVAFVSEAAPKEVLQPGKEFNLYYGFKQVGYAVIKELPIINDRADVPLAVSKLMGNRPVRWAPPEKMVFDYDGRERTLQVFNAAAKDQLELLKALRPIRAELQKAAGGPLVIIFHSPEQSESRYGDFLATWSKASSAHC